MLAPQIDKELLKQRKHSLWTEIPAVVSQSQEVIEEECKAEILQQIQEEIEKETGEKPDHKEVLRRYQPTMTSIMVGLDKKELQEAEEKAKRWTNQAPDAAVEAKMARKKGEKMVKSFAKEMYIQASMRVFVLGSWKDEKGSLLTSGFDFNEQLNQDEDQDVTLLGGTWWVPKPHHEFDLDCLGSPILPELEDLTIEMKKAMIRPFLTIYYRKYCGKLKVLVPWSDIMKGQSRFISSTYLPDNTNILEPSKLLSKDTNAILNFWWERQETQVGPTFMFKGWIDDKGQMHSPVAEDESDSDADDESPRPRPRRKPLATRRIIKRPCVSSTEEESEKTEAEASPPAVTQYQKGHTYAEYSDRSIDRPTDKSLKVPPQPRPLILHISSQRVFARKVKAAKVATSVPLDPPAKGTRSNSETLRTTRTRQKPKRYNDYI
ncbi:hypothetical protein BDR03DRAFT_985996 [Suillus americanus]|nr:hypothetical protein BDR03DRAFT_985996 [Suillus americanus]